MDQEMVRLVAEARAGLAREIGDQDASLCMGMLMGMLIMEGVCSDETLAAAFTPEGMDISGTLDSIMITRIFADGLREVKANVAR